MLRVFESDEYERRRLFRDNLQSCHIIEFFEKQIRDYTIIPLHIFKYPPPKLIQWIIVVATASPSPIYEGIAAVERIQRGHALTFYLFEFDKTYEAPAPK
jgi:hypothetical protein